MDFVIWNRLHGMGLSAVFYIFLLLLLFRMMNYKFLFKFRLSPHRNLCTRKFSFKMLTSHPIDLQFAAGIHVNINSGSESTFVPLCIVLTMKIIVMNMAYIT